MSLRGPVIEELGPELEDIPRPLALELPPPLPPPPKARLLVGPKRAIHV